MDWSQRSIAACITQGGIITSNAWDDFAEQLDSIDLSDVVETSVRNLILEDILDEIQQIDTELAQRSELINPVTQEARDLHSRRAALTVEKHRKLNDHIR